MFSNSGEPVTDLACFHEHVFILTICFVNNYVCVVRLNKPLIVYHSVDA